MLITENRPPLECDVENLVGFFEAKFYDQAGNIYSFPTWDGGPPLDLQRMCDLLAQHTIYTFNGNNYDLPIITLALHGADHVALKEAGDAIIIKKLQPWDFYKRYGIEPPEYIDHVDVAEVAPGVRISLKAYAGRMHAPRMQDLPVDPMVPLPPGMRVTVSNYCDNDLRNTRLLREGLKDRLNLRIAMSEKYGVDVRSKSDAQIAEAVIKAEVIKRRKEEMGWQQGMPKIYIDKRYIPHGFRFAYVPPPQMRFVTPQMQEVFNIVRTTDFVVTDKEEAVMLGDFDTGIKTGVQIPTALYGKDIHIGLATYRLGIGGLHSQESCVSYYSDDDYMLLDIDVKSYYPSLILQMRMFPTQLGEVFLTIYEEIYKRRLWEKSEAERKKELAEYFSGDDLAEILQSAGLSQTEADGLKIVLNGTFGKLFSKWSILYAPELGIRVTMSGQLYLLMLIEMMEMSGIQVVSANTDGIVLRIPRALLGIARGNVKWWERLSGLEMEESEYRSIHFRDVNNYVAITTKGKAKRKGVFTPGGLLSGPQGKHPDKEICGDAVVAYLTDGTPIERTIRECKDIRKFVQIRAVKGGGEYMPPLRLSSIGGVDFNFAVTPQYLGKTVRWYYGTKNGYIRDSGSGNKVAGSSYAVPVMELPNELPSDIDYSHYELVAYKMLAGVGIPVRYWHHAESEVLFITAMQADDIACCACDELDAKTFKRWENKYARESD